MPRFEHHGVVIPSLPPSEHCKNPLPTWTTTTSMPNTAFAHVGDALHISVYVVLDCTLRTTRWAPCCFHVFPFRRRGTKAQHFKNQKHVCAGGMGCARVKHLPRLQHYSAANSPQQCYAVKKDKSPGKPSGIHSAKGVSKTFVS
mmetsp:Transcript_61533/g.163714  ORF Transcript_61533/g.163714 Transcript_61533/m.163714 type:complete len:144 (-) Transcript_61533:1565-1996(-)